MPYHDRSALTWDGVAPTAIDAVNLKHVLHKIDSDRGHFIHPDLRMMRLSTAVARPLAGAVPAQNDKDSTVLDPGGEFRQSLGRLRD